MHILQCFILMFSFLQDEDGKTEEYTTLLVSYWDRFLNFLPQLVIALAVIIVFFILGGVAGRTLRKNLGKRLEDQLLSTFLGKMLRWSVIVIGLFVAMNVLGFGGVASGLIAGLGASALIVGFAFKDIGENFLAGMILAFNRPFDIGDTIASDGYEGTVVDVDMRMTHIKTFATNDVYIPNSSIIKNPLLNYSRDNMRRHVFVVGIEYADDIGKAIQIIRGYLKDSEEVCDDPSPQTQVDELGASSVNIVVRFWVDNSKLKRSQFDVKSDMIKLAKEKLTEAGIDIPFNILQLEIHDKDEPIPLKVEKSDSK